MHKSATKCNETISKWCKNMHGASKIIDTFETYHRAMRQVAHRDWTLAGCGPRPAGRSAGARAQNIAQGRCVHRSPCASFSSVNFLFIFIEAF
jgi:hypothetical protein